MSGTVTNTTHTCCPICAEDYKKNETSDTKETLETACGHLFHVKCIGSWITSLESKRESLRCGYCNQIFLRPNQTNVFVLKDKSAFLSALAALCEEYSYDDVAVEAIKLVRKYHHEILEIQKHLEEVQSQIEIGSDEYETYLIEDLSHFVIQNEGIQEDLKGQVLMVIAAMIEGRTCLRTLEGESRRWQGVPLDQLPEKIRKEGVLVGMGTFMLRVSANCIHRSSQAVLIDDITRKLLADAEYISAIPRRVLGKARGYASCFFRYAFNRT